MDLLGVTIICNILFIYYFLFIYLFIIANLTIYQYKYLNYLKKIH